MTATHQHRIENSTFGDGLPKSFIKSMSTLFDIMDDRRTGYVRFIDIERRWHEDGTQGLPKGVLESLRQVTPPNGYLSFDRFCTGLKMSLLRNEDKCVMPLYVEPLTTSTGQASPANSLDNGLPAMASSPQSSPKQIARPLSAPLLDQDFYGKRSVGTFPSQPVANRKPMPLPIQLKNQHTYMNKVPMKTQERNDIKNAPLKSAIRMGTASNMPNGPPKPPRVLEMERHVQTLGRNIDSTATLSLEREARSNRRNLDSHDQLPRRVMRRDRGGSLERLLDSTTKDPTRPAPHPHSKTGMRSALQTWFKERSKSDLQKGDTNNNYHTIHKLNSTRDYYKTSRPPPPAVQSRSSGDGGAVHKYYQSNGVPYTMPPVAKTVRSNPVSSIPPVQQNDLNEAMYARTTNPKPPAAPPTATYNVQAYSNYNDAHKTTTTAAPPPTAHGKYVAPPTSQVAVTKKTTKKKEPRRHTLQNGIDYNGMRRLQQLEAERDMLYQGLDVVERARQWYKQQLASIAETIHYLPLSTTKEPNLDSQREKMHFQLARIHEINAHLRALMDPEKGMQAHMNLAIRTHPTSHEQDLGSQRTKEQNKLLTEEVSVKGTRISSLEREKAALLRELFQARAASQNPSTADSFM